MVNKSKYTRIAFTIGVVALILGVVDPLEGSVIIAAGSVIIALTTFLTRDRHCKLFLAAAIMICFGVFCIWYVSFLGGYDPKHEWWWNVLIFPYPAGWIMNITILIVRMIKKPKNTP